MMGPLFKPLTPIRQICLRDLNGGEVEKGPNQETFFDLFHINWF